MHNIVLGINCVITLVTGSGDSTLAKYTTKYLDDFVVLLHART